MYALSASWKDSRNYQTYGSKKAQNNKTIIICTAGSVFSQEYRKNEGKYTAAAAPTAAASAGAAAGAVIIY